MTRNTTETCGICGDHPQGDYVGTGYCGKHQHARMVPSPVKTESLLADHSGSRFQQNPDGSFGSTWSAAESERKVTFEYVCDECGLTTRVAPTYFEEYGTPLCFDCAAVNYNEEEDYHGNDSEDGVPMMLCETRITIEEGEADHLPLDPPFTEISSSDWGEYLVFDADSSSKDIRLTYKCDEHGEIASVAPEEAEGNTPWCEECNSDMSFDHLTMNIK